MSSSLWQRATRSGRHTTSDSLARPSIITSCILGDTIEIRRKKSEQGAREDPL